MLIVCPSCATSYNLDVASLEPNGRQVRCVRCRTVWHAESTRAEKLLAAAGAIAPGPEVAPDSPGPLAEGSTPPAAASPATAAGRADWYEPPADSRSLAAPAAIDDEALDDSVEAPSIAPVDLDDGRSTIEVDAGQASEHGDEPSADTETFAARHPRRSNRRGAFRWPLSQLQNGILALLIADAVIVGWRDDVVRILPQTASFYAMIGLGVNLRGVAFQGVTTTTEQHDGVPVLVVAGNMVNETRSIVDVPRLKFAARNAARDEIYSWTAVPPRASLPAGETVAFRTRFASPPPDVRDVLVRFVTRGDILAGAR